MRTRIRPDRTSCCAAVLVALALAGCSQAPADRPAYCVLGGVDGDLVRVGDTPVLANARWNGRQWDFLALRLPAGWTVRRADDGELEVLDASGVRVARTGTHAFIGAAMADTEIVPLVIDGALVVCPT